MKAATMLRWGVGLAGATAIALYAGGLLLPGEYAVERVVRVDARPEVVWALVSDLRHHALWAPHKATDPYMRFVYEGPTTGVGANYAWTSEHSGDGLFRVDSLDEDARDLRFSLSFEYVGDAFGRFLVTDDGAGSVVTWSLAGAHTTLAARWVGLASDAVVGASLEDGLQRLGRVAADPAELPTALRAGARGAASPAPEVSPPAAGGAAVEPSTPAPSTEAVGSP